MRVTQKKRKRGEAYRTKRVVLVRKRRIGNVVYQVRRRRVKVTRK